MYHFRGDMGKYWEKAIRGGLANRGAPIVMRRFHNLLSIIILIDCFVNDRDRIFFVSAGNCVPIVVRQLLAVSL